MSKREGKSYICDACAISKGLVTKYPNGGNTVIRGLCGHCDRADEDFLTPTCDFKDKNDKRTMRNEQWD